MTKKSDQPLNFTAPPPDSDWQQMVEYFRPKSPAELMGALGSPPQPTVPSPRGFLDQLQLRPEEFVALALQQPELWSPEEIDELSIVAQGGTSSRLDELAREYFEGRRSRKEKRGEQAPPPVLTETIETPRLSTTIPDLDVLQGTVGVDRWWERR